MLLFAEVLPVKQESQTKMEQCGVLCLLTKLLLKLLNAHGVCSLLELSGLVCLISFSSTNVLIIEHIFAKS